MSSLSRNLVPEGPAVIGVAEVENHRVLTDLVSQPAMANYKFVHYEGPDRRGIDCALLYDPQQFAVTNSKLVLSAPFEGDTVHLTRGFLIVDGRMAGERVFHCESLAFPWSEITGAGACRQAGKGVDGLLDA